MGNEVAVQAGGVPALAHDPASQITAEDISFPRLYIAQDMHDQVQEGLVKRGSIFVASGSEDPAPNVVAGAGKTLDGKTGDQKGVDFYVLALKKGKSISVDGNLFTYAFDDPDAPEKCWVTYTYLIAAPGVDEVIPLRWLLTRTGRPTAQRINQVLALSGGQKPSYTNGFNLTTKETKNDKGRFFVPVVKPIEPTDEALTIAERQFQQFAAAEQRAAVSRPATDEPAI